MADSRQKEVIDLLWDEWENASNDKAMYHSVLQELKAERERLLEIACNIKVLRMDGDLYNKESQDLERIRTGQWKPSTTT